MKFKKKINEEKCKYLLMLKLDLHEVGIERHATAAVPTYTVVPFKSILPPAPEELMHKLFRIS